MRKICAALIVIVMISCAYAGATQDMGAKVPKGLSEREAQIWREGYSCGYYDALNPVDDEGHYILNTKSHKFHLPSLKRQRKRQLEQRIAAGEKWVEDDITRDLVFRQPNGKAHSELSIYKACKAAGQEIGVPGLHPHDLRHSYAVAALRSGVDVKTVQHNLGHKSASITLDTYAAYTSDAGREGAKKLSDYLKNAGK